jgi:hypothetical protein
MVTAFHSVASRDGRIASWSLRSIRPPMDNLFHHFSFGSGNIPFVPPVDISD